jgi:hypothetical protein
MCERLNTCRAIALAKMVVLREANVIGTEWLTETGSDRASIPI